MALPHFDPSYAVIYPFEADGTPMKTKDFVLTQEQIAKLVQREMRQLGITTRQLLFTVDGEPTSAAAVRVVVDGKPYDPKAVNDAYRRLSELADELLDDVQPYEDTIEYVYDNFMRMAAAGVDVTNENFLRVLLTDDEELASLYEANCPYYEAVRQGLSLWEEGLHLEDAYIEWRG